MKNGKRQLLALQVAAHEAAQKKAKKGQQPAPVFVVLQQPAPSGVPQQHATSSAQVGVVGSGGVTTVSASAILGADALGALARQLQAQHDADQRALQEEKKKKRAARGLSGYMLFCKLNNKGGRGGAENVAEQWRALSDAEKAEYKAKGAALAAGPDSSE